MKKILIILSGVLLVYGEPVIAQNEITGITIAKKISKAKSVKKKNAQKKKKTVQKKKKTTKKSQKKKKTIKKYNVKYNLGEVQNYAHQLVLSYGWSEEDYNSLVLLWYRESSWNLNAVNKRSGACGIPQSLPCSKMKSAGADYRTNYKTQIRWGLNYIKAMYGSPANAWGHSQKHHWY